MHGCLLGFCIGRPLRKHGRRLFAGDDIGDGGREEL